MATTTRTSSTGRRPGRVHATVHTSGARRSSTRPPSRQARRQTSHRCPVATRTPPPREPLRTSSARFPGFPPPPSPMASRPNFGGFFTSEATSTTRCAETMTGPPRQLLRQSFHRPGRPATLRADGPPPTAASDSRQQLSTPPRSPHGGGQASSSPPWRGASLLEPPMAGGKPPRAPHGGGRASSSPPWRGASLLEPPMAGASLLEPPSGPQPRWALRSAPAPCG